MNADATIIAPSSSLGRSAPPTLCRELMRHSEGELRYFSCGTTLRLLHLPARQL